MTTSDKYDVYVEGVWDSSPAGIQRAVQALAPRLAMPPERVTKLLTGRFRVRTAVDQDTARELVHQLEEHGLRVAVAPTGSRPATRASGAGASAAVSRAPTTPALAPARAAPPAPALLADDDGGISIGGLDGSGGDFLPSSFGPATAAQDERLELTSRLPPPRPASLPGPRPPPPPRATSKPPAASPPREFAPPDPAEDRPIDLAIDPRSRLRSLPPSTAEVGPTAPPAPAPAPAAPVPSGPSRVPATRGGAARVSRPPRTTGADTRSAVRSALGRGLAVLVVALAIGYFPAQIYADHVDATQIKKLALERADLTVNPWKVELRHRTPAEVSREIDQHRFHATLLMMAIWGAVAALLGALAYLLF